MKKTIYLNTDQRKRDYELVSEKYGLEASNLFNILLHKEARDIRLEEYR